MAMLHVTIFGGSGFIGRHLVARLAATRATMRVATRHPALMPTSPGQVGFKPVRADILDEAEVRAAIQGCDAVVNLVGILAESGCRFAPKGEMRNSTKSIAILCR